MTPENLVSKEISLSRNQNKIYSSKETPESHSKQVKPVSCLKVNFNFAVLVTMNIDSIFSEAFESLNCFSPL